MAANKILQQKKLAKRFAHLYVNGPLGLQGDWKAVEDHIKAKFDFNDPIVRDAIVGEGGATESQPFVPDVPVLDAIDTRAELLGNNNADKAAWIKLADELAPVAKGIADGTVKASAAQVAMIKSIHDRAYGKISSREDEKVVPSGVVILPTLGERMNMILCPKCKMEYRVEDINEKQNT